MASSALPQEGREHPVPSLADGLVIAQVLCMCIAFVYATQIRREEAMKEWNRLKEKTANRKQQLLDAIEGHKYDLMSISSIIFSFRIFYPSALM